MKIIEPSTPDELQRYYDLRWKVLRFYRKQGYETRGPGHTLFNSIAHVKMSKDLV